MLSVLLGSGNMQSKIIGLFAMLFALVIALSIHEWAHGFAAYKNGDLTAKYAGRLTLNPLKHLDVMGFAMLLIAGFGWAKPVPVNPNNFKKLRKGIITVSLAGVSANLLLSILSAGCLAIFYAIVGGKAITSEFLYLLLSFIQQFFLYLIVINLTLMAFNILPIYPLDGFHVLETFTKYENRYCVFMRRYGSMVLFGFILGSSLLGTFAPYLDVFGMYIRFIQNGVLTLFGLIFHI